MQRVVTLTLVVPVMAGMVLPPIGFCLIPPNRQDQRGQQDWWGRLKLKTPLEWGPAGVGHGGGAAAHGMSCVVPQRSPRDLIRLR